MGRLPQKLPRLRLQQPHQFWLHVFVVVGDVEADHAFVAQVSAKVLLQFGAVGFFHDEDDVCPADLLRRESCFGVVVEAGGIGFHVWPFGEDVFCRWAAEFVLAANEKSVDHGTIISQIGASSPTPSAHDWRGAGREVLFDTLLYGRRELKPRRTGAAKLRVNLKSEASTKSSMRFSNTARIESHTATRSFKTEPFGTRYIE